MLSIILSWSSVSFKVSTVVAYRISTVWIYLFSSQLILIKSFWQEFSINDVVYFPLPHIMRSLMLICPIICAVNFAHSVKEVSD